MKRLLLFTFPVLTLVLVLVLAGCGVLPANRLDVDTACAGFLAGDEIVALQIVVEAFFEDGVRKSDLFLVAGESCSEEPTEAAADACIVCWVAVIDSVVP